MAKTTLSPSDHDLTLGRENPMPLDASVVGNVTAAVLSRVITKRKTLLRGLTCDLATIPGTDPTTITVNVDGVAVPGLVVTYAAGSAVARLNVTPSSETIVDEGSVVDIEVTAVGNTPAPADLTASANLVEVYD